MNSRFTTNTTRESGFTIVELLIVIVVIGILAAITLVAFGGVRDRANTSSAQSSANEVVKKAEIFKSIQGSHPTVAELMNTTTTPVEARVEGTTVIGGGPSSAQQKTHIQYNTCTAGGSGFRVGYYQSTSPAGVVFIYGGGNNGTCTTWTTT